MEADPETIRHGGQGDKIKRNALLRSFKCALTQSMHSKTNIYFANVNLTVFVSVPLINVTSDSSPGLNLVKASV